MKTFSIGLFDLFYPSFFMKTDSKERCCAISVCTIN